MVFQFMTCLLNPVEVIDENIAVKNLPVRSFLAKLTFELQRIFRQNSLSLEHSKGRIQGLVSLSL